MSEMRDFSLWKYFEESISFNTICEDEKSFFFASRYNDNKAGMKIWLSG